MIVCDEREKNPAKSYYYWIGTEPVWDLRHCKHTQLCEDCLKKIKDILEKTMNNYKKEEQ